MDKIDYLVGSESIRLVRKDKTKYRRVLGLYALSLKDRELGKLARASYFFVRHLDDLLDGEMGGIANPLEYALNLRAQVETNQFTDYPPIAQLAGYVLPVLEQKAQPGDNPRAEFTRVIDALLFDYYRRQERRALSEDELTTYYHEVLDPGLNLMLIGFGSELRASNIPDFSPSLGRLYSLRDLNKDWQLGFINIPQAILSKAGLTPLASFEILRHSPTIDRWISSELQEAALGLENTQSQLSSLAEPLTQRALNGLINQALKINVPQLPKT